MCREVFLNIALPLGLAAAGAVYVLTTGWLDRRTAAGDTRGHVAE
jgi:hypothetical protein